MRLPDHLLQQWSEAYAAFRGAFDTPQMRRQMPDEYSTDARRRLRDLDEALRAAALQPEAAECPTWVLLMRPGRVPMRKGPLVTTKLVEQMLRDLYAHYPDATCVVVRMPATENPQSGREWLAMHGDRRRKVLAAAPAAPHQRRPTDEEIRAWCDRHDLGISSLVDLRCIFEDAQTLCGVAPPVANTTTAVRPIHR